MKRIGLLIPVFLACIQSCMKQPANNPPVIESIILYPGTNYTPGSDVEITAQVRDMDGDPLEYFWATKGGVISNPDLPSTVWEISTSSEPLSYESVTLTVSDGKALVSKTRTIQISEGLQVSGHTYFKGSAIPVPGATVTIGKFTVVSGEDGSYTIQNLKEGNTLVTASKEGFEEYEELVYVDNPKSTYQIYMSSPSQTQQLTGLVQTVDGVSYAGLKVVILNPDGGESELVGYTDPSGAFLINTVPLGSRQLMIKNYSSESHFLNDSVIYQFDMGNSGKTYNARIKIKRTIIDDNYMSEPYLWNYQGTADEGFYVLEKGEQLGLKDFISIPEDAENIMVHLNSYVIGGCDLVRNLPSHRIWIANTEGEYLGGISWGGEGTNYTAKVEWYPSESPTFLPVNGRLIKLNFELYSENTCVPNPIWRIYQVGLSYYR